MPLGHPGMKVVTKMVWIVWALGLVFVGYAASQSFSYTTWFAPMWIFLPLLFINIEQACICLSRSKKAFADTKKYNKVTSVVSYCRLTNSDNDDEACAICLSVLETGDKVRRLPCRHIFHKECMDDYFDRQVSTSDGRTCRSPLCAVCRQEILSAV